MRRKEKAALPVSLSISVTTKFIAALLFLCCLVLSVFQLLPVVIERAVLPGLFQETGVGGYRCRLFRLSPRGCVLQLRLGDESDPLLTTGSIRLGWRLGELLHGEIDEVEINGAHLRLRAAGTTGKAVETGSSSEGGFGRLPLINTLLLNRCSLSFTMRQRQMLFAFSARLRRDGDSRERTAPLNYAVRLLPTAAATAYEGRLQLLPDRSRLILTLHGISASATTLPAAGGRLSGRLERLMFTSTGKLSRPALHLEVELSDLMMKSPQFSLKQQNLFIRGDAILQRSGGRYGIARLDAGMRAGKSGLDAAGYRLVLPGLELNVRNQGENAAGAPVGPLEGLLKFSNGRLSDPTDRLQADRMSLTWPFRTDGSEKGTRSPAHLRIGRLSFKGKPLGTLDLDLVHRVGDFRFSGRADMKVPAGMRFDLSGAFRVRGKPGPMFEVTYASPLHPVRIAELAGPVPFLQQKGISGSGRVAVNGRARLRHGRLIHTAQVEIAGLDLVLADQGIAFDNIRTRLYFPSLPSLATAGGRHLKVETVHAGKLTFKDVDIDYRLEPSGAFFLEKAACDWAGGKVFTAALRLAPAHPEVETAIYCDRVVLARLLTELGLAEAAGEGTISGRIPILFRDGRLRVDRGFLYSTPGEKRTLRIPRSALPIPAAEGEGGIVSPLFFAGAAFEHFEYDWAGIEVKSRGEDLRLELRVLGRPMEPLPFRFDSGRNGFVRLPENQAVAFRQPLKLDVNFTLPLNAILAQREIFGPLLKSMQSQGDKP